MEHLFEIGSLRRALSIAFSFFLASQSAFAALESTLAPMPEIRQTEAAAETTPDSAPASAGVRTDTIAAVNPVKPPSFKRPWFSTHVTVSPNGFGSAEFAIQGRPNLNAAMGKWVGSAAIDFQPLHFLGVWGVGPTLDVYFPVSKISGQPAAVQSAFAAGGEVRYQAWFSDRQPIVPSVSYAFKYLRYRLDNGALGGLYVQEPSIGLWLNLSWVDPEITRSMRRELGIQRAYLMFDYRRFISGETVGVGSLSLSGDLIQAGLRFEF
jgi:hypothetical protein